MSSTLDDEADAITAFIDPAVAKATHRLGQMLRDKWRLDVLLGVGGMAAVYAATHRNGSRAAIKILHAELSANHEIRARFMREGYAANAVGHEGAVKVIDDDVAEDGSLYLVTELLDGETLEGRFNREGGRLGEDDALSVADQLLDVLAAGHAKGVVHRDIKPANVFLMRTGQLKVLDFGIARLREISGASLATKSGATLGTPAFMSPEQARGLWDEVDGRTDVWAVGASLWQALTGTLVHQGRTPNEELLSAMTKAAPSILTVLPTLSPVVAQVVDRALAFERENRWRSAREMQEAVRRAYHDRHGAPLSTAPRITVPETVPNRTLSSAAQTAQGVTAQPTTGPSGSRVWRVGRFSFAPPRLGPAIGVVGGIIGIVTILGWALSGSQSASPASSLSVASSSAPAGGPAVAAPAPAKLAPVPPEIDTLPAIAATDLPAVTTSAPPPAPLVAPQPAQPSRPAMPPPPAHVASPSTTPASQPAPAAAKPNCSPPYILDPVSGKKHFKVECL
jgi:serine/threonine-protein kinase